MNPALILSNFLWQDGGAEADDAAAQAAETGTEATQDAAQAGSDAVADQEWLWEGDWQGSYFFPEQASDFAGPLDNLFGFIFWVSLGFFVLICGAMVWFVIAYRKRPGYTPKPSASHNTPLEIAWSVLPSIILVAFFVLGVKGYMDMRVPPDEAYPYTIRVYAKQWAWRFVYPDGEESDMLHIPANTPVRLQMQSDDVLHSFWVPAFRTKQDIVPGRYTYLWVNPTEVGEFRLYCTEYCGDGHSIMRTRAIVHDLSWDEMMNKIRWRYPDHTDLENGERLYRIKGCNGCHSIDGSAKTGPSFQGQFGTVRDTNQGEIKMDEEYISRSIRYPAEVIRSGYGNQMPTFQGKLKNEEIDYLIEFIKSLN